MSNKKTNRDLNKIEQIEYVKDNIKKKSTKDDVNEKKNFLILIFLFFILAGCSAKLDSSLNAKPKIYASFYVAYDFAKKIGGDFIDVINIMPNGVEPHDWEISTHDIINLEKADALIYNGVGFESWIDRVKNTLENKIKYINLAEDLNLENDPHIWLNPVLAKKQLKKICDGLSEISPNNKKYYEQNYLSVSEKLDELDKEIQEESKKFKSKDIIVAHSAYKYFCDEYGLNQIALEGIEENSEPTLNQLKKITDLIKNKNIKYIFYENTPSKAIKIISDDTDTKLLELNPIEYLTDNQIKDGEDYFSIMRKNLENLKVALE